MTRYLTNRSNVPRHWNSAENEYEEHHQATQAFINMSSGGAIPVMLADTMVPEAFQHGGQLTGIITVMGFARAAYLSVVS